MINELFSLYPQSQVSKRVIPLSCLVSVENKVSGRQGCRGWLSKRDKYKYVTFLRSVSELGTFCLRTDLKKSHICPIWGQSDPIWVTNLTSLLASTRRDQRNRWKYIISIESNYSRHFDFTHQRQSKDG